MLLARALLTAARLPRTWLTGMLLTTGLRRAGGLLTRLLRGTLGYGRTTSAPPPASSPAGLSGGRIRSLIHGSLLNVIHPQIAGFPHS
jgi:hypothetical protein